MTESIYATIAGVINEPAFGFDDLRIIADSGKRLDASTRRMIVAAADEFEATWRTLIMTQHALIEEQQRRIALNDRLIEVLRKQPPPPAVVITAQWKGETVVCRAVS